MIQQARGNESNWFTIPNYKQLLPFFLFETDFNIFLFAWRINVLTHIKKGRPFPPETPVREILPCVASSYRSAQGPVFAIESAGVHPDHYSLRIPDSPHHSEHSEWSLKCRDRLRSTRWFFECLTWVSRTPEDLIETNAINTEDVRIVRQITFKEKQHRTQLYILPLIFV